MDTKEIEALNAHAETVAGKLGSARLSGSLRRNDHKWTPPTLKSN